MLNSETIVTVETAESCYVVTDGRGVVTWVPQDPANMDYRQVQAWIGQGNATTPYAV